jgi:sugar lactone lactonase YvrE
MCSDNNGAVYIADFLANKTYKYDDNARRALTLGNPSEVYNDVTVDNNGTIYVLGMVTAQGFIRIYDSLGNAGAQWPVNPTDLAIFAGQNQIVYTCGNNAITGHSTANGSLVSSWTIPGKTVNAHNAYDIKVTGAGATIVTDIESDQIYIFSPAGALVAKGGGFANLTGLALDKYGNLYGAESGRNRIVKIQY